MPPRLAPGLEREIGHSGAAGGGYGLYQGSRTVTGVGWIDDWEETPELRWPANLRVFDSMRRTDAQTRATLRATILPLLRRARWRVGGAGADPRVVQFTEVNMGLTPERQARARRKREGLEWASYLRQALSGQLAMGHSVFEPVYRIGPPPPDLEAAGLPPRLAHLRKLAPRPQRTIAEWLIARDGGLAGVRQYVHRPGLPIDTVTLPVERLVAHVNDREGAEWRGESVLRASYKHWLIKDALLRVGPMAVERNGMGLPVVTFDENDGGSRERALAIARAARAGDDAGVALPKGYTLQLIGVSGQTRDELPLVKYHDQAIGRNALTMVLDLGHDDGARALGDTFAELLAMAVNSIAADFAETVTEHVIRDLVVLNFGEDEPYPVLMADELTPERVLTPQDLKYLVDSGVVIPDDELEADRRRVYRLPPIQGSPTGPVDVDVEDGVVTVPQEDDPAPTPAPVAASDPRRPTRAQLQQRALDVAEALADAG